MPHWFYCCSGVPVLRAPCPLAVLGGGPDEAPGQGQAGHHGGGGGGQVQQAHPGLQAAPPQQVQQAGSSPQSIQFES